MSDYKLQEEKNGYTLQLDHQVPVGIKVLADAFSYIECEDFRVDTVAINPKDLRSIIQQGVVVHFEAGSWSLWGATFTFGGAEGEIKLWNEDKTRFVTVLFDSPPLNLPEHLGVLHLQTQLRESQSELKQVNFDFDRYRNMVCFESYNPSTVVHLYGDVADIPRMISEGPSVIVGSVSSDERSPLEALRLFQESTSDSNARVTFLIMGVKNYTKTRKYGRDTLNFLETSADLLKLGLMGCMNGVYLICSKAVGEDCYYALTTVNNSNVISQDSILKIEVI